MFPHSWHWLVFPDRIISAIFTSFSYKNGLQRPTHHYVPSPNKLEPRLEDGDVQDVNEVTQVVGQQPVVNVVGRLVGEGPADWDEPHIPVPG